MTAFEKISRRYTDIIIEYDEKTKIPAKAIFATKYAYIIIKTIADNNAKYIAWIFLTSQERVSRYGDDCWKVDKRFIQDNVFNVKRWHDAA